MNSLGQDTIFVELGSWISFWLSLIVKSTNWLNPRTLMQQHITYIHIYSLSHLTYLLIFMNQVQCANLKERYALPPSHFKIISRTDTQKLPFPSLIWIVQQKSLSILSLHCERLDVTLFQIFPLENLFCLSLNKSFWLEVFYRELKITIAFL